MSRRESPAGNESVRVGDREIGPGRPVLLVGEVAQAHDGSLAVAHAFVDAIADAGADAVKFQTHIAAAESTPSEPWRVRFSPADETRYDYWKRMEFTPAGWAGLKEHADERGLVFLSSPFSIEAVELLQALGTPAWKVASGELSNTPMLDRVLATELPVLLSTGMSPWAEVDAVVERVREAGVPFAVLQTTSAYPCEPERVGLNVLAELAKRYACPVGLSDHSGTVYAGLAAVALGASIVEVHVTLSREMPGPDVGASLTTGELKRLVEGVRFIERSLACPVDKDAVARDLAGMRDLFTRSVVVRTDLPAGTVLTEEHLAAKKPGTGIPADRLPDLVGRRLARDVEADHLIEEGDLK